MIHLFWLVLWVFISPWPWGTLVSKTARLGFCLERLALAFIGIAGRECEEAIDVVFCFEGKAVSGVKSRVRHKNG